MFKMLGGLTPYEIPVCLRRFREKGSVRGSGCKPGLSTSKICRFRKPNPPKGLADSSQDRDEAANLSTGLRLVTCHASVAPFTLFPLVMWAADQQCR